MTETIDPTHNPISEASDEALDGHNWYAEVGARRRVRSRFPEAARLDMIYPTKPDSQRASYFDPDGRHSDYCLNDELKAISGVDVADDHILIPHDTVDGLDVREDERDELDELVWRILSKMRVDEVEQGGEIMFQIPEAPSNRTDDERRTDPRPVFVECTPGHHWNALHELKEKRRVENRDIKGLITARDSETGHGQDDTRRDTVHRLGHRQRRVERREPGDTRLERVHQRLSGTPERRVPARGRDGANGRQPALVLDEQRGADSVLVDHARVGSLDDLHAPQYVDARQATEGTRGLPNQRD